MMKTTIDRALALAWYGSSRVRGSAWGFLLDSAGSNLRIDGGTQIRNPGKVRIGCNSWLKERVIVDGRSARPLGISIGDSVVVRTGTYIDAYDDDGFVEIGNRAGIGQYVYIGGNGGVTIGEDVMISGHSFLVAATHYFDPTSPLPYARQGESREGISVGRNAWIAARCVVVDGVTIGANAVIGAGSVVTRDVPPDVFAAGTPAKVIRDLSPRGS